MGEHRDDSKAGFSRARSGQDKSLRPSPDTRPPEDRGFSQSGDVGSQPGLGQRLAATEDEDQGHLGRSDLRDDEPDSGENDRARGARKHQPGG